MVLSSMWMVDGWLGDEVKDTSLLKISEKERRVLVFKPALFRESGFTKIFI